MSCPPIIILVRILSTPPIDYPSLGLSFLFRRAAPVSLGGSYCAGSIGFRVKQLSQHSFNLDRSPYYLPQLGEQRNHYVDTLDNRGWAAFRHDEYLKLIYSWSRRNVLGGMTSAGYGLPASFTTLGIGYRLSALVSRLDYICNWGNFIGPEFSCFSVDNGESFMQLDYAGSFLIGYPHHSLRPWFP
jgi:hypothetical protein